MVFKVVGGQPGPAGYIYELWRSADSLNEDVTNVLGISRSFPIPYKNRLVSSWQTTKPKEVRHIEISKADRTTWHKHDTDRTKLERCCTKSSTDAVSLCFGFYRGCLCLAKLNQPCRFQCVTWYIFADQVCFGSYVLRHIRLRFLHANSELTQQDRRAKKAANLVRQA